MRRQGRFRGVPSNGKQQRTANPNEFSKSDAGRKSSNKLKTAEGQLKQLLESIEGKRDDRGGSSKTEVRGSLDAIESITQQIAAVINKSGKTRAPETEKTSVSMASEVQAKQENNQR